jgi:protein TonB
LRPGAPAQNGRVRVGGAIKPPVRLVNVNPVYPEDARAAGVEGLVVLQIAIGEDGSVIEALVLRSIPMLDQAAIDAVIQWVYQPTLLNGMPVEVEMTVTINFTLR